MELLRVVDNNGNDTNEILEREELHNRGKLHNEVTIYIINNKKEVLLQRRSKNRRFCPNMLGVIAGHVSYNETPLVCAGREIKEEVIFLKSMGTRKNLMIIYIKSKKDLIIILCIHSMLYVIKRQVNSKYRKKNYLM